MRGDQQLGRTGSLRETVWLATSSSTPRKNDVSVGFSSVTVVNY